MELRILGAHSLETSSTRHTCFLVDGVLAIDAGSLVSSLSWEEQAGIRAILLTHRHFDHVRDLPSLGLATLDNGETVAVYSLAETLEIVVSRLMDGVLYPDLTTRPTPERPKYHLCSISPEETFKVMGYTIKAVAVPHSVPAVGYIVRSPEGRSVAYLGDVGGGLLPFFIDPFMPDPLLVEVTVPSRLNDWAAQVGHLTPDLLRQELLKATRERSSMPRIVVVHMRPDHEEEIREELGHVSTELGVEITPAIEDMVLII